MNINKFDILIFDCDGIIFDTTILKLKAFQNTLSDFEEVYIDGGAKCPKFNIVGSEELNNLELAQIIANCQNKELKYEMVDFHSSRPGHDLRYSLSGEKMKKLGWQPSIKLTERIKQVVEWSLNNQNWIEL